MERRSQGVSAVRRTRNAPTRFSEEGIVQGDDQRGAGRLEGFDFGQNLAEENVGLDPLHGIELVLCGPILELATVGG
jgi:hypothetical protein